MEVLRSARKMATMICSGSWMKRTEVRYVHEYQAEEIGIEPGDERIVIEARVADSDVNVRVAITQQQAEFLSRYLPMARHLPKDP